IRDLLVSSNVSSDAKGLIVGLGNWDVTPDALGPKTVENILVTNHLFELDYETVASGYRPVAAISQGVMGVTGMRQVISCEVLLNNLILSLLSLLMHLLQGLLNELMKPFN